MLTINRADKEKEYIPLKNTNNVFLLNHSSVLI